jgi:hypothetical protein
LAGRGVQPRWLTEALKGGKLDDYLIEKNARKPAAKTRRKRT